MKRTKHNIVRQTDGVGAPEGVRFVPGMAEIIASHRKISELLRGAYAVDTSKDAAPFLAQRVMAAAKAQPRPSTLSQLIQWATGTAHRRAFAWSASAAAATLMAIAASVAYYSHLQAAKPVRFESFVIYQAGQTNGFVQYFEYTAADTESDRNESG